MIQFKLDYVIEKTLQLQPSEEQKMIEKLSGVKLQKKEAKEAWERILDHKWYVSERLGRDVGFKVATIDYFENIHRTPSNKKSFHRKLLQGLNPRTQNI